MRKIAVAMDKGGVGKTTTAVHLAAGLAHRGKRVLLIDCDTQNQSAIFLGVEPGYGLFEFMTGKNSAGEKLALNEILIPARKNLYLMSGGINLEFLKNWLYELPPEEKKTKIANRLVPGKDSPDFIIFDCAPSWDLLSVNILASTDEILCPVQLEGPAMIGLKNYINYVNSAKTVNPELEINYIVPTRHDKRTRQSVYALEQLRAAFGGRVCDPIHLNVRVSEASANGQTVFEYSKRSVGARDYKKLIRRVLKNGER